VTRYVVRRLDRGWYWVRGGLWTVQVQHARTFAFVTNAEMTGFLECPLPIVKWDVVPVESQEAAFTWPLPSPKGRPEA
jgi:hypothetical protein